MTSANEIDHAQEIGQHKRSLWSPVENLKLLDEHRDQTLQAAASWGAGAPDRSGVKGEDPD